MAIQIPSPKERNLFLSSQVDQASINALTKSILDINEDDVYLQKLYEIHGFQYTPKPIKLYIDSYGGYAYQCLGLLSIMKKSAVPIQTITTGCAMSCGFLIAITGKKRLAYEKSTFLYHQVSSGSIGKLKEIEEDVIETKRLQSIVEKHTLDNTSITKQQLKENYETKKDWFMNAKEALKFGVIDEII